MKKPLHNQQKLIMNLPDLMAIFIVSAIFFAVGSIGATNYYVSLTGNDSYKGTSPDSAWRTVTYSATKAKAGDIVYIKGGNYNHEHVVVSNYGTSSNPVVFEGYEGIPVLDAGDYDGKAIYLYGKPYVTLKNIKVANYRYGIWVDGNSHHVILDSCVADSCCNTNYTTYGYDGYGILVQSSNYCTIKNCTATDNGGNNYFLTTANYCTVENCRAYSKQTASNQYITDYYVVLAWSSYNTIRNCYVEDINGSYKGNHGFIIKDGGSGSQHSTGNLFINCTAKKFEEGFACAHDAYKNLFDSCYADNTGKHSTFNFCFQNRDGAHDNTFSNCTGVGLTGIASVYTGTESSCSDIQNNTLFVNCIFRGVYYTTIGAFLRNATNTTFKNCTYVNIPYLFRFSKGSSGIDGNSGTLLKNSILSGVTTQYDNRSLTPPWSYNSSETGYSDMDNVAVSYTDFWAGFAKLSGTGNISADPLFADSINSDFHLKSQYGRWNGTSWINDEVTSQCINAGDPQDDYSVEPSPNGNRINMGAYGNTAIASLNPDISDTKSIGYLDITYYIQGQNLIINLPAENQLNGQILVTLTTMDGKTAKMVNNNASQIVVDLSAHSKGIMICTVSAGQKTQHIKLLKN